MSIAAISHAIAAYGAAPPSGVPAAAQPFAGMLAAELRGARDDLGSAEQATVAAAQGQGDLQDVVEAMAQADLSLQKVTAVRDRLVAAYQDIMRMPI